MKKYLAIFLLVLSSLNAAAQSNSPAPQVRGAAQPIAPGANTIATDTGALQGAGPAGTAPNLSSNNTNVAPNLHAAPVANAAKVDRDIAGRPGLLSEIEQDNHAFVISHDKQFFERYQTGQKPRAVLIGCADSRFQLSSVDKKPINDIFAVRNAGNNYFNNKGSVQYGVNHLGAKVIFVIGHVGCGAVTAATKGYRTLEPEIQKELQAIKVAQNPNASAEDIEKNVKANVDNQITEIIGDIQKGDLKGQGLQVFGAIYDFQNHYGKGYGALVLVNYNGKNTLADLEQMKKDFDLPYLAVADKPE